MNRVFILLFIAVALLLGGWVLFARESSDPVLDRQEATSCAVSGNAARLKILLGQSLQLANYRTAQQVTMLHLAARSGSPETIDLILQSHVSPSMDRDGNTPLHMLAGSGYRENTERFFRAGTLLLAAGCDVNAVNNQGQTALHSVAPLADGRLAIWLIGKGAKPNIVDKRGQTPLDFAIAAGATEAARVLSQRGAVTGQTPSKPLPSAQL